MFAPTNESLYTNLVGADFGNTQFSNDETLKSSSSSEIIQNSDETKNTEVSSTNIASASKEDNKNQLRNFTFDFLMDAVPTNTTLPPSFDPKLGGFVKTPRSKIDDNKQDETLKRSQMIEQIVDSSGGVCKVDKVADFITLLNSDDLPFDTRSLLLTMMLSSRPLVQEAFVSQDGLSILDKWLNEENIKLIPLILKLLIRLPVDWQALKDNGKIGKTVKKLSGHSDKKIKKQAKQLLKLWMKLVSRATKKPSNKRKELDGAEEPARKKPKLASSSAFSRNTDVGTATTELKIVKRNPVVTKDNPSNKVKPTNDKPNYQPLKRLTEPKSKIEPIYEKSSPPLRLSSDNLRQSRDSPNDLTNSSPTSPKDKKTLTSCLRDPQKAKKARSISWAPNNALVRVKLFPRDRTLAIDNPNMQMIKARLAAHAQGPPSQPETPQMRPSTRWRSPPVINLPSTLNVAMGEQSTEVSVQRERQRTTLKVNYPDVRHIPSSPADDSSREAPLRDSDIPVIPLHDTMKDSAPVPVATPTTYVAQSQYNSPPPYSNSPTTSTFASHPPNRQDIINALASGRLNPEIAQSVISNPSEQNIALVMHQLLTNTQTPPTYPTQPNYQQPSYYPAPNYPSQGNYQGYGRTQSYYPPGGRY